ncbi:pilus assembly protein [Rodentibacter caecimuris]|uniref:Pilus assembly protein n=1 Tax=Rodentibacter caecimuris TaxID=1796644 RepID=A0A1V3KH73_9PAST|nr:pilus assembly protein [Rodentibacter heylii]OOF76955.1 pilus assembly protein [Rodentibacter heylii]
MLLLDNEKILTGNMRKIVVISSDKDMATRIAELLRTRALENIEIINKNLFDISNIAISSEDTFGVIVDLEEENDAKIITDKIYSIIPQSVWCCVIGKSDSIALSQQLLNKGILYFHASSQINQMVENVAAGVDIPTVRNTVKVSVLSCKGGIGATLISSHIANQIALNKKVPVLLAQGKNGSQDLDLLFDKKLQGDIVEYSHNFDLFSGVPSDLSTTVTDKYNFIIYDQPIFNVKKDDLPKFFEHSNNFLLIVERRIASLRVAKQFLEECERMRNMQGKPIRTFICISDSRLETSKLMVKTDIETLLGSPVDAVIPVLKNIGTKNILSVNLGRKGRKEIEALMMKVIGSVSRTGNKAKEKSGFFSSFVKSFINR